MNDVLSAAVEAFCSIGGELASRDTEALEEAGEWHTDAGSQFDASLMRRRFEAYDDLYDEGLLKIPLHEVDDATLTGEYVLYDDTGKFPKYVFFNESTGERERLSPKSFAKTELVRHVLLWGEVNKNPELAPYDAVSDSDIEPTVIDPVETPEAEEFFGDLIDSVERQRESDRRDIREAYDYLSAGAFHDRYGGTSGADVLSVDDVSGVGTVITVEMPQGDIPNAYGIYPENEVLVGASAFGRRSPPESVRSALPVEGEVESVDGSRMKVAVFGDRLSEGAIEAIRATTAEGAHARVCALFNPVPYDREVNAVRNVKNAAKSSVLVGSAPVTFAPDKSVDATFSSLNQYQTAAARRAIAADDVALIHGPPGTGKTRTLSALIGELVERGDRVLACAHSNQATDNLIAGGSTLDRPAKGSLHRAALFRDFEISRVGRGSTNSVVTQYYTDNAPRSADVVVSTMSAAHQFEADEFDVVVIDEGSQASIPATLIPFDKARKSIIAGDHKQLPPYSSSDLHEDEEVEVSLFEYLIERYGDDVSTMLRMQYRMNERIAEFPSEQFYDGKLETADQNRNWTVGDLQPVEAIDVQGDEVQTPNRSYANETEAEIAAEEVEDLLTRGLKETEIGVITPYTGQIGVISEQLESRGISGVKVDTVDSFQGGEREAIVVSFVRSNDEGRAGFLTTAEEGPRRLNVAMTRARKRLTMVADWDTLCADADGEEAAETYRELVDWLEASDLMTEVCSV